MTVNSSLASVSATRAQLAKLGLSSKKSLGQHFLVEDGIVGKIIRLADLAPNTRVVEVGPGLGTLTEALLATGVELTAVEKDSGLLAGLQLGLAKTNPRLSLISADALAPATLLLLQGLSPTALVANLPYAVAATIVLAYWQKLPTLTSATVMVQREVAERIAAAPGGKEYGAFTVKLGLLACVVESFAVPPQSFWPPPKVDSTVIKLERVGSFDDSVANASMLANAAFFQRRKTIRNSMRAYFAAHDIDEAMVGQLLALASIDPKTRGETLAPKDFLNLADAFSQISNRPR